MVYLPNIRRKHLQAQVLPSGSDVWADFDLSKLGAHAGVAALSDSASGYYSGQPLRCYGLQTLPDGSLLISAEGQGHAYVWGFETGHEFEVSHFNSFYSSRTGSFSSLYSVIANHDGTVFYRQSSGSYCVYMQPLGQSYNISTAGSTVTVVNGQANGILVCPQYMFFSSDGNKLFYKNQSGNVFYCMTFDSPWPTATVSGGWKVESLSLAQFDSSMGTSTFTWRGFTFSPDGKSAVFTTNTNVVKFVLTNPWDITTVRLHSFKNITDDVKSGTNIGVTLAGVAINDTGTKMIVHNRASDTMANCKFYEYNLVA